MKAPKFLLLLFIANLVFAIHYEEVDENISPPWFTGPLIATSATTIPGGHLNFEPYFSFIDQYASYNNHWKSIDQPNFWTLNYYLPLWIGLSSWSDIIVAPTVNWNRTGHQSEWVFGDTIAGIEFQLYRSRYLHTTWVPSIKLALWETFPTGKYRNLSPKKRLTDDGGEGVYASKFRLMIGRMEHVYADHFFKWILNFNYTISSEAHVKGFHAYGGGTGTNGKVRPGQNFRADLGMEYNLTKNWALALDLIGTWQQKNVFQGTPGLAPNGQVASNTSPSSIQYSMVPAIEYNFSQNLGIIGGVWLSIAGKNIENFYSGITALNYYR